MTRAALVGLVLFACAQPAIAPTPAPEQAPVQLMQHVAHHLSMLHRRLHGHMRLPDHEWATCLEVERHGDAIRVVEIDAAYIQPGKFSDRQVVFSCMERLTSRPAWGAWHPHLPSVTGECEFSQQDIDWQDSNGATVMLVSCGDRPVRFISRVLE